MTYTAKPYQDTIEEFREMRNLLVESYSILRRPRNWLFSRLEDWKYGGNSLRVEEDPSYFLDKACLWCDACGRLAGFCISEYGGVRMDMQVHPEHTGVQRDMLRWMVSVWGKGKPTIETTAYSGDSQRAELLHEFGFVQEGEAGVMREYDLSEPRPTAEIYSGYVIRPLSEIEDRAILVRSVNAAFGQELNQAWLDSVLSAPALAKERVFLCLSPEGTCASFCFGLVDHRNAVAEIDPVGTHPDHRRMGLAKAVILECFDTLARMSVRTAYISSAPEPNPSNRLYESLAPSRRLIEERWVRHL